MHATALFAAISADGGLYKAIMTVHVIAAIVWLGGGTFFTLEAERAKLARNDKELATLASTAEFWATRLFIPSSIVLILCGFGMIGVGHLGFTKPFIDIGLVGWVISFGLGTGFLGPQGGKVKVMLEASGGEVTEAIRSRILRILLVARVDIVILFLVAGCMVVQPWGSV